MLASFAFLLFFNWSSKENHERWNRRLFKQKERPSNSQKILSLEALLNIENELGILENDKLQVSI